MSLGVMDIQRRNAGAMPVLCRPHGHGKHGYPHRLVIAPQA